MNEFRKTEQLLKHHLKKRQSVTMALVIAFLITGIPFVENTLDARDLRSRTKENNHIIPDTGGPNMSHSANNTDVINIKNPNSNGISHNKFKEFNVGSGNSVIFNNNATTKDVVSSTGGLVQKNTNLSTEASTILNEVNGVHSSNINGTIEIAGKKADFILANENGINLNGASFINTNGVTLTTGRVFEKDNSIQLDIKKGNILLNGVGTSGDYFNVLAQTIELYNEISPLKGEKRPDITMVSGNNILKSALGNLGQVDILSTSESRLDKCGIYSDKLGAMYGRNIRLISTGSGLGVKHEGSIFSEKDIIIDANGDIFAKNIVSEGKLNISGKSFKISEERVQSNKKFENMISAKGDIKLKVQDGVELNSILQSYDGNIDISAKDIINRGIITTNHNLKLLGKNILNEKEAVIKGAALDLEAESSFINRGDIRENKKELNEFVDPQGKLKIKVTSGVLENYGNISAKNIELLTQNLINSLTGKISAIDGDIVITTFVGDLINSGEIFTKGNITITSNKNIVNKGKLSADNLMVQALQGNFLNAGNMSAIDDLSIKVNSLINAGSSEELERYLGEFYAYSESELKKVEEIIASLEKNGGKENKKEVLSYFLNIKKSLLDLKAELSKTGTLGTMVSKNINISGKGDIKNSGIINSTNKVEITGNTIGNTGVLQSEGTVLLKAIDKILNSGRLTAKNEITIDANSFVSTGDGELLSKYLELLKDFDAKEFESLKSEIAQLEKKLVDSNDEKVKSELEKLRVRLNELRDKQSKITAFAKLGVIESENIVITTKESLVNNGVIISQKDISLSSKGDIENNGTTSVGKSLMVKAQNFISKNLSAGEKIIIDVKDRFSSENLTANDSIEIKGSFLNKGNLSTNKGLTVSGDVKTEKGSKLSAKENIKIDGGADLGGDLITNGDFTLDNSQKDFSNKGNLEVSGNVNINAKNIENNNATIGGNLVLTGKNSINNTGKLQTKNDTTIKGNNFNNYGEIISGNNFNANLENYFKSKDLNVKGDLNIQAEYDIDNTNSITVGKNSTLKSIFGDITTGTLHTQGKTTLDGRDINVNKEIISSGVEIKGNLNSDGTVSSKGDISVSSKDKININNKGKLVATGDIILKANRDITNKGMIVSNKSIKAKGDYIKNDKATIWASNDIELDAFKNIENTLGTIEAKGNISLTGQELINEAGVIKAGKDLNINADSVINKSYVVEDVQIKGYTDSQTVTKWDDTFNYHLDYVKVKVPQIIDNSYVKTKAIISSGGDLTIKGKNENTSTNVVNESGTIASAKNIDITGNVKNSTLKKEISLDWILEHTEIELYWETKLYITHAHGNSGVKFKGTLKDALEKGFLRNSGDKFYTSLTKTKDPVLNQVLSTLLGADWKNQPKVKPKEQWNKEGKFTFVAANAGGQIFAGQNIHHRGGEFINDGGESGENKDITIKVGEESVNGIISNGNVNIGDINDIKEVDGIKQVHNVEIQKGEVTLNGVTIKAESGNIAGSIAVAGTINPIIFVDIPIGENGIFKPATPKPNGIQPMFETNIDFIDPNKFYGSDYFFNQIGYDKNKTSSVIGDAYYEYILISKMIQQGLGYTGEISTENMKSLLDNALNLQNELNLEIGKPLTPEQINRLDKDIIWYVEIEVNGQKTLTPQIYFSNKTRLDIAKGQGSGGSSTVKAGGNIITDNTNFSNTNGNITADGNIIIKSQNDIVNSSSGGVSGGITSNKGNIALDANGDVNIIGGSVKGDNVLVNGNNVNIKSTVTNDKNGNQEILDRGSIQGNNGIQIDTKKDVNIVGGNLTANGTEVKPEKEEGFGGMNETPPEKPEVKKDVKYYEELFKKESKDIIEGDAGSININAKGDVNIKDMHTTSSKSESQLDSNGNYSEKSSTEVKSNGSNILGSDVNIKSDKNVNIKGSNIGTNDLLEENKDKNLKSGSINIDAKKDVNIEASKDIYQEKSSYKKTSMENGLLTTKWGDKQIDASLSKGSSLQTGGNLNISSGNNVKVQGSDIVSNGNTSIDAENNVDILDGRDKIQEKSSDNRYQVVGGGTSTVEKKASNSKGSNIITGGDFTVNAKNDIKIVNGQINSSGNTKLKAGNDISIEAGKNEYTEKSTSTNVGIYVEGSVGVGGVGVTGNASTSDMSAEGEISKEWGGDSQVGENLDGSNEKTPTTSGKPHMDQLVNSELGLKVEHKKQEIDETTWSESQLQGDNITIESGNKVDIGGGDYKAKNNINITGKSVESKKYEDKRVEKNEGFTVAVKQSQGVSSSIADTINSGIKMDQAIKSGNGNTGVLVAQGVGSASNLIFNDMIGSFSKQSANVSIENSKKVDTSENITSMEGKNINIKSTAGDITLNGVDVKGEESVSLDSKKNINVSSAKKTSSEEGFKVDLEAQLEESAGYSALWGGNTDIGVGGSVNVDVTKNNSTEHINSQIKSDGNLSLKSGNDTNIKGGELEGKKDVTVDVGGNLNIESQKSSYDENSINANAGGNVSIGGATNTIGKAEVGLSGGGGNLYKKGETVAQSGIKSGGNLNVTVGKDVNIIGGVLGSETGEGNLKVGGNLNVKDITTNEKQGGAHITVSGGFSGDMGVDGTIGDKLDKQVTSKGTIGLNSKNIEVGGDIILNGKDSSIDNINNDLKNSQVVDKEVFEQGGDISLSGSTSNVKDVKDKINQVKNKFNGKNEKGNLKNPYDNNVVVPDKDIPFDAESNLKNPYDNDVVVPDKDISVNSKNLNEKDIHKEINDEYFKKQYATLEKLEQQLQKEKEKIDKLFKRQEELSSKELDNKSRKELKTLEKKLKESNLKIQNLEFKQEVVVKNINILRENLKKIDGNSTTSSKDLTNSKVAEDKYGVLDGDNAFDLPQDDGVRVDITDRANEDKIVPEYYEPLNALPTQNSDKADRERAQAELDALLSEQNKILNNQKLTEKEKEKLKSLEEQTKVVVEKLNKIERKIKEKTERDKLILEEKIKSLKEKQEKIREKDNLTPEEKLELSNTIRETLETQKILNDLTMTQKEKEELGKLQIDSTNDKYGVLDGDNVFDLPQDDGVRVDITDRANEDKIVPEHYEPLNTLPPQNLSKEERRVLMDSVKILDAITEYQKKMLREKDNNVNDVRNMEEDYQDIKNKLDKIFQDNIDKNISLSEREKDLIEITDSLIKDYEKTKEEFKDYYPTPKEQNRISYETNDVIVRSEKDIRDNLKKVAENATNIPAEHLANYLKNILHNTEYNKIVAEDRNFENEIVIRNPKLENDIETEKNLNQIYDNIYKVTDSSVREKLDKDMVESLSSNSKIKDILKNKKVSEDILIDLANSVQKAKKEVFEKNYEGEYKELEIKISKMNPEESSLLGTNNGKNIILYYSPTQKIEDYFSTIVHELTHQDQRNIAESKTDQFGLLKDIFSSNKVTGGYIKRDTVEYTKQPMEKEAFESEKLTSKIMNNLFNNDKLDSITDSDSDSDDEIDFAAFIKSQFKKNSETNEQLNKIIPKYKNPPGYEKATEKLSLEYKNPPSYGESTKSLVENSKKLQTEIDTIQKDIERVNKIKAITGGDLGIESTLDMLGREKAKKEQELSILDKKSLADVPKENQDKFKNLSEELDNLLKKQEEISNKGLLTDGDRNSLDNIENSVKEVLKSLNQLKSQEKTENNPQDVTLQKNDKIEKDFDDNDSVWENKLEEKIGDLLAKQKELSEKKVLSKNDKKTLEDIEKKLKDAIKELKSEVINRKNNKYDILDKDNAFDLPQDDGVRVDITDRANESEIVPEHYEPLEALPPKESREEESEPIYQEINSLTNNNREKEKLNEKLGALLKKQTELTKKAKLSDTDKKFLEGVENEIQITLKELNKIKEKESLEVKIESDYAEPFDSILKKNSDEEHIYIEVEDSLYAKVDKSKKNQSKEEPIYATVNKVKKTDNKYDILDKDNAFDLPQDDGVRVDITDRANEKEIVPEHYEPLGTLPKKEVNLNPDEKEYLNYLKGLSDYIVNNADGSVSKEYVRDIESHKEHILKVLKDVYDNNDLNKIKLTKDEEKALQTIIDNIKKYDELMEENYPDLFPKPQPSKEINVSDSVKVIFRNEQDIRDNLKKVAEYSDKIPSEHLANYLEKTIKNDEYNELRNHVVDNATVIVNPRLDNDIKTEENLNTIYNNMLKNTDSSVRKDLDNALTEKLSNNKELEKIIKNNKVNDDILKEIVNIVQSTKKEIFENLYGERYKTLPVKIKSPLKDDPKLLGTNNGKEIELYFDKNSNTKDLKEYITTIIHELAHQDQNNIVKSKSDKFGILKDVFGVNSVYGGYIKKDDNEYKKQPIEKDAYTSEKITTEIIDNLLSKENDKYNILDKDNAFDLPQDDGVRVDVTDRANESEIVPEHYEPLQGIPDKFKDMFSTSKKTKLDSDERERLQDFIGEVSSLIKDQEKIIKNKDFTGREALYLENNYKYLKQDIEKALKKASEKYNDIDEKSLNKDDKKLLKKLKEELEKFEKNEEKYFSGKVQEKTSIGKNKNIIVRSEKDVRKNLETVANSLGKIPAEHLANYMEHTLQNKDYKDYIIDPEKEKTLDKTLVLNPQLDNNIQTEIVIGRILDELYSKSDQTIVKELNKELVGKLSNNKELETILKNGKVSEEILYNVGNIVQNTKKDIFEEKYGLEYKTLPVKIKTPEPERPSTLGVNNGTEIVIFYDKDNKFNKQKTLNQYLDTIVHETTHQDQNNIINSKTDKFGLLKQILGINVSNNGYLEKDNMEYKRQPVEREAYESSANTREIIKNIMKKTEEEKKIAEAQKNINNDKNLVSQKIDKDKYDILNKDNIFDLPQDDGVRVDITDRANESEIVPEHYEPLQGIPDKFKEIFTVSKKVPLDSDDRENLKLITQDIETLSKEQDRIIKEKDFYGEDAQNLENVYKELKDDIGVAVEEVGDKYKDLKEKNLKKQDKELIKGIQEGFEKFEENREKYFSGAKEERVSLENGSKVIIRSEKDIRNNIDTIVNSGKNIPDEHLMNYLKDTLTNENYKNQTKDGIVNGDVYLKNPPLKNDLNTEENLLSIYDKLEKGIDFSVRKELDKKLSEKLKENEDIKLVLKKEKLSKEEIIKLAEKLKEIKKEIYKETLNEDNLDYKITFKDPENPLDKGGAGMTKDELLLFFNPDKVTPEFVLETLIHETTHNDQFSIINSKNENLNKLKDLYNVNTKESGYLKNTADTYLYQPVEKDAIKAQKSIMKDLKSSMNNDNDEVELYEGTKKKFKNKKKVKPQKEVRTELSNGNKVIVRGEKDIKDKLKLVAKEADSIPTEHLSNFLGNILANNNNTNPKNNDGNKTIIKNPEINHDEKSAENLTKIYTSIYNRDKSEVREQLNNKFLENIKNNSEINRVLKENNITPENLKKLADLVGNEKEKVFKEVTGKEYSKANVVIKGPHPTENGNLMGNTLTIHTNKNRDIVDVFGTIVHEYTHNDQRNLQEFEHNLDGSQLPYLYNINKTKSGYITPDSSIEGYKNQPLEKEAYDIQKKFLKEYREGNSTVGEKKTDLDSHDKEELKDSLKDIVSLIKEQEKLMKDSDFDSEEAKNLKVEYENFKKNVEEALEEAQVKYGSEAQLKKEDLQLLESLKTYIENFEKNDEKYFSGDSEKKLTHEGKNIIIRSEKDIRKNIQAVSKDANKIPIEHLINYMDNLVTNRENKKLLDKSELSTTTVLNPILNNDIQTEENIGKILNTIYDNSDKTVVKELNEKLLEKLSSNKDLKSILKNDVVNPEVLYDLANIVQNSKKEIFEKEHGLDYKKLPIKIKAPEPNKTTTLGYNNGDEIVIFYDKNNIYGNSSKLEDYLEVIIHETTHQDQRNIAGINSDKFGTLKNLYDINFKNGAYINKSDDEYRKQPIEKEAYDTKETTKKLLKNIKENKIEQNDYKVAYSDNFNKNDGKKDKKKIKYENVETIDVNTGKVIVRDEKEIRNNLKLVSEIADKIPKEHLTDYLKNVIVNKSFADTVKKTKDDKTIENKTWVKVPLLDNNKSTEKTLGKIYDQLYSKENKEIREKLDKDFIEQLEKNKKIDNLLKKDSLTKEEVVEMAKELFYIKKSVYEKNIDQKYRDIEVEVNDYDPKLKGSYSRKTGVLSLYYRPTESPLATLKTIAHELTHVDQHTMIDSTTDNEKVNGLANIYYVNTTMGGYLEKDYSSYRNQPMEKEAHEIEDVIKRKYSVKGKKESIKGNSIKKNTEALLMDKIDKLTSKGIITDISKDDVKKLNSDEKKKALKLLNDYEKISKDGKGEKLVEADKLLKEMESFYDEMEDKYSSNDEENKIVIEHFPNKSTGNLEDQSLPSYPGFDKNTLIYGASGEKHDGTPRDVLVEVIKSKRDIPLIADVFLYDFDVKSEDDGMNSPLTEKTEKFIEEVMKKKDKVSEKVIAKLLSVNDYNPNDIYYFHADRVSKESEKQIIEELLDNSEFKSFLKEVYDLNLELKELNSKLKDKSLSDYDRTYIERQIDNVVDEVYEVFPKINSIKTIKILDKVLENGGKIYFALDGITTSRDESGKIVLDRKKLSDILYNKNSKYYNTITSQEIRHIYNNHLDKPGLKFMIDGHVITIPKPERTISKI